MTLASRVATPHADRSRYDTAVEEIIFIHEKWLNIRLKLAKKS